MASEESKLINQEPTDNNPVSNEQESSRSSDTTRTAAAKDAEPGSRLPTRRRRR